MPPAAAIDRRAVTVLVFLLLSLAAAAAFIAFPRVAAPHASSRSGELIARADDFYFQYTREDNEAAIALYERIVEADPDDTRALSGLANALVQRAMRWPLDESDRRGEITMLGEAHASGRLNGAAARRQIERAHSLAVQAVRLAPQEASTHKALGLALSANGEFEKALAQYGTALEADPDAWGVLINVGDVLEITGRSAEALPHFERAYAAMSKAYASQSAQVRPWQARLGAGIAERYLGVGDDASAEKWYREVLALAPLDRQATLGLARLLAAGGSTEEAARLCRDLAERAGGEPGC
jgi:Flp pilus assembly protein TadD